LSPDGHVLAAASWNEMVQLWTMRGLVASLPPHASPPHDASYGSPSLVFSADSSLLAINAQAKVVQVWNMEASEISATLHMLEYELRLDNSTPVFA
jgi:WD40 repeat protein